MVRELMKISHDTLIFQCRRLSEDELFQDISNLHIYECMLNYIFAEFYPFDYDKPDGRGWYLENQEDMCSEILGDEFIQKLRMKQKEEKI